MYSMNGLIKKRPASNGKKYSTIDTKIPALNKELDMPYRANRKTKSASLVPNPMIVIGRLFITITMGI